MKQTQGVGRLNKEIKTGAKFQKRLSSGRGRRQTEGGSGTKYRREHHCVEGKKEEAGYGRDVSRTNCSWKTMGKAHVKAATAVKCSMS